MNAELENLIVLQAQDLDLARLRTEVAEAPRRVKQAETALAAAQKSVAGLRSSLAEEEKLRRGQESEIASHRAKLVRLRRSLDSATSTAQVTAFEHEISFGQTTIATLEDAEFASMERTESLEQQLKAAEAQERAGQQRLDAERTDAARLTAEHTASIAGIERQRKELRGAIDASLLSTYDRLSKAKGTAIAEALGNATQGKCSACQMGVRPQRWQDLIGKDHLDEIFKCETCGRMLFWDPRRDTPKAWDAGDRLRSAQASGNRTPSQAGSER